MDYTFQWGEALKFLPDLFGGLWITLHLSFLCFVLAALVGLCGAAAKTFAGNPLRRIADGYVVFFINIPGLVLTYFFFFGLPEFGIFLSPYLTVVLATTLKAGAYLTEIMRGGFNTVRRAELDAAETLGMSMIQALRYVVVPHVIKTVYAPMSGFFIWLILMSAGASIFGVEELTARAFNAAVTSFRSIEIYSITALMYVGTTAAASLVLALVGNYFFRVKIKIF